MLQLVIFKEFSIRVSNWGQLVVGGGEHFEKNDQKLHEDCKINLFGGKIV